MKAALALLLLFSVAAPCGANAAYGEKEAAISSAIAAVPIQQLQLGINSLQRSTLEKNVVPTRQLLQESFPTDIIIIPTRLVFSQTGVAAFWKDPAIDSIVVHNQLVIDRQFWRGQFVDTGGVAVLAPDNKANFTISSDNGSELSFGFLENAMLVTSGGLLVFKDILLQDFAFISAYEYSAAQPYRNVGVGWPLWPTLVMAPNSMIHLINVSSAYQNPAPLDTCETYTERTIYYLQQQYGNNVTAFNATTVALKGPLTIRVVVQNGSDNSTVGHATAVINNARLHCVPRIYKGESQEVGLGPGALAAAIIVPTVAMLAAVVSLWLWWRRKHQRRYTSTGKTDAVTAVELGHEDDDVKGLDDSETSSSAGAAKTHTKARRARPTQIRIGSTGGGVSPPPGAGPVAHPSAANAQPTGIAPADIINNTNSGAGVAPSDTAAAGGQRHLTNVSAQKVVAAGSNTGSRAQAAAGMGQAVLRAAANFGQGVPVWGPFIAAALGMAADVLSMVQQVGLNRAQARLVAERVELIRGVLQDLQAKAVTAKMQFSQTEEDNIVKALQQHKKALNEASLLLAGWVVSDKSNVWQVIQRFVASRQDGADLFRVDQQLCTSYNQLVNVLNTCSLFQLQLSASRAEAVAAACHQDIASFEQNLINIAGSVDQVQQELQRHRQEMQQVWPMLERQGVQLSKLISIIDVIPMWDSKLDEILTYMRQQQQRKVHMPKPDMLILPDDIKLLGHSLGEGASGAVFLAKFHRKEVAVKCFFLKGATGQQLKEVYKEAILLSKLQHHPNIIRCYGMIANPRHDVGNSKAPFNPVAAQLPDLHGSLVMEKCDMDLSKMLADDKVQLNLLDKVCIALDIASGMRYLHHGCGSLAPVVHGDLKPGNILVNLPNDNKLRQIIVCDFGISHTCQISSTLYTATTGRFRSFGSLQWLAPETCEVLIRNKKGQTQPSTTAVDLYAFGLVLFEVITRQQPYAQEDAPMLPFKVFNGLRPPAREWLESLEVVATPGIGGDSAGNFRVLQQLVTLMESCWAADPATRPSFSMIVAQLERLVKQLERQLRG